MFKAIFLSSLISFAAVSAEAATYYVAKNGSDRASGTSSAPFLTISKAMNSGLNPGDTVIVRPGVYAETVTFKDSGAAGRYITLKSEKLRGAKINATGKKNGIFANQRNYLKIEGFEVYGAQENGILTMYSHHIEVRNSLARNNKMAGIYLGRGDYFIVEGNVTHSNSDIGPSSGLSIKYPENLTGNKSTSEFRIIVRNNISYNNITKQGPTTDGCGIILDDFNFVNHEGTPYRFKSLVENNLSYGNSGRGIQVVHTENALIRNNTVYHNNVPVPGRAVGGNFQGELSNLSSSNNTWVNNIAVTKYGVAIAYVDLKNATAKNVVWKNNLTFNGTVGQASVGVNNGKSVPSAANGNKLGVDPRFYDAASKDFSLRSSSPAINNGTNAYGVSPVDLSGSTRVRGGTVDIGAYEY